MSNEMPISVCVPTYNRAAFLPAAIESVLPQLGAGDELVIVDNHSSDGTAELLKKYERANVRVVRNVATVSMYANHNVCVREARHGWVLFLHSDDALEPRAIETLRTYARRFDAATCFYPANENHTAYVKAGAMELQGISGLVGMLRWPCGAPTGAMYRRDFLAAQPFREEGLASDFYLLCIIMERGGMIVIVPEPLVKMGRGSFQASHNWAQTGEVIMESAAIYREVLTLPGVAEAMEKSAASWTDWEIAFCLRYLAYADQRALIGAIEERLGTRDGYKKIDLYKHVRFYLRFGHGALVGAFKSLRFVRRNLKKSGLGKN